MALGALAGVQRTIASFEDDAEGGWRKKIAIMRALARADVSDPEMQERWNEATKHVANRDYLGEIRAWFNYIRRNVRYTPAAYHYTQVFCRPAILFRKGFGDCVQMSTAAGCGLGIGGYDSSLVLISTRSDEIPSHVYNLAWYPPRAHAEVVPFDAAAPHRFGWEVPQSRISWHVVVPLFSEWHDEPQLPAGLPSSLGRVQVVGWR